MLKYPSIPDPTTAPENLLDATLALKQAMEIVTGQRGDKLHTAVTWADLVALGVITKDQVPK